MAEQEGIIELLSHLDEYEIFALAKTVTQGLLKIENKNDAITGILKHSPNVVSILRRKILTREILFSYIDEKNISVVLPATKNDLIDIIVDYWKNSNNQTECIISCDNVQICNEIGDSKPAEGSIDKLAEHFAKWFYNQINTKGVESAHFFSDAKLKLSLISNDDCDISLVDSDPQEISNVLLKVRLQHNLYFNPNFSNEGLQGRIDPHGLVKVLVCGTLHIEEIVAGVFEQVFALARDPFSDNNWKIKHTELILRSKSDVLNQPKLCDSELTSNLLLLPSN